MGESRNAYRVLVRRPEGKRPLGRPRRRWEDNIKMDLREVGYGDREWINLAQDRDRCRAYVRAAMNLRNKVLRKIFGAKKDEVTGEWRKLHNTELQALYSSPDIIRNIKSRRLRWAGQVARMGESRNAYRVLVGRPKGKRPLGRPRRRWEDNIKMDLREVGYDDREWIHLAQDRDQWRAYVREAMNFRISLGEHLIALQQTLLIILSQWIHERTEHLLGQSHFEKKATQSRKLQENLVMVLQCLAPRRYGRSTNPQNLVKQHLGLVENLKSLYRRPPEAADSLDRPPWIVVKRRWMASAMATEADVLGGGVSPRTDRGALGEIAKQEWYMDFCWL
ncbi:hypothetical protein ANN_25775 [Periplaneta americana]|uniref:Uncharacterized protein n=1 Tax=Periplaneta americana TaxID=6978 RepID=A0ABQ8S4G6_PERAM|nr:hypothetical protein ANN_25775 [Periplaneta americana]